MGVRKRHVWALLIGRLKGVLNFLDFSDEELIDKLSSLLKDVINDCGSLCELVPVFEHLNGIFNRSHILETVGDDRGVDDLNSLDVVFE